MPTVKRYRPPKRVTLLVGKRSLKRRQNKKVPRNSAYEKLKNNNIALAQALSKEKQENQFLYSQTVKFTGQLQDMQCSLNRRNDALTEILESSSEALKLLVQATNFVTNNIVTCQRIVGRHSNNLINQVRGNVNTNLRRESSRRSLGKSPARGVVQPMVSGHTITKPVINLSRINMQRIAASPNMSDIEETAEINNVSSTESLTPVRIADRQNKLKNRRLEKMMLPERIRLSSPRVSDENEQRSPIRSRRINDKKRKSKDININIETDEIRNSGSFDLTKSPRVALQDVSRLLHNCQRVNVRTLLENGDAEESIPLSTVSDESPLEKRSNKRRNKPTTIEDDPLEGPSWLLDDSQNVFSSDEADDINNSDSPRTSNSDMPRMIQTQVLAINISRLSDNQFSQLTKGINSTNGHNQLNNTSQESEDQEADDGDTTNDETRNLNLNRFNMVNQERSRAIYDEDDFTMIINRPPRPAESVPFDVSELNLPVLENPLINPSTVTAEPEPEITKTVRQIVLPDCRPSIFTTNLMNNSMNDLNDSMTLPTIQTLNIGDISDDGSEVINNQQTRKRAMKNTIESSSDSDSSPPPKKNNLKTKKKITKRKDPSAAKVVLKKLADSKTTRQRSSSPDPRRSSFLLSRSMSSTPAPDPGSESDSSFVSNSSATSSRPRRQKAPVSLKEPNLSKKMRRG